MRILVVEDEKKVASFIQRGLEGEGFSVEVAYDGESGVEMGSQSSFDLILMDVMLPKMDGLQAIKALREKGVESPVLCLTAKDTVEDIVAGLDSGSDDYLTKPFHREELIARIHAIIRRSKGHSQSIIKTGDIEVNLDGKTVEVRGNTVHLTGKEYQMLKLLSLRKGTTLTKEMFLNHLYGGMDEPELKIIDVFIKI